MKRRFDIGVLLVLFVLLMASCGGNADSTTAPAGMRHVQINETDFKIESSVTSFSPAVHYHFAVTNNGKTAHEFMILPKSEGGMETGMGNMDKMALAAINTIKPSETKTLDYTFPSSAASSHPEFACYLPGHYQAGMKEKVSVS